MASHHTSLNTDHVFQSCGRFTDQGQANEAWRALVWRCLLFRVEGDGRRACWRDGWLLRIGKPALDVEGCSSRLRSLSEGFTARCSGERCGGLLRPYRGVAGCYGVMLAIESLQPVWQASGLLLIKQLGD